MKKATLITTIAILLAVQAFSQSFRWARQVTGNQGEVINDMTTDASGNIYVVGSFTGTITLGTTYTARGSDIWLAKYSSSGSFIWGKVISDTGPDTGDDNGLSITLDDNNNVYICGNYSRQKDFNPGGSGGTTPNTFLIQFFAKYTSTGSFQWVNSIETGYGFFNSITFSKAHNRIYVGGFFSNLGNGVVDFDPDPEGQLELDDVNGKAFIASYALNGAIVTAKNFGASSNIKDLAIDPAGNVYATGYLEGSSINLNPNGFSTPLNPANGRMFVAKYNANIDYISADQIGSSGINDEGLVIIAPSNEQIFYGGSVNGGLHLARRNSNFDPVFEKSYGGSGAVTAITANGSSLYFSASSSSNTPINLGNGVTLNPVNYIGDILLAKTSLNGLASWGATIPVSNTNFTSITTSMKAVGNNEFILAGYFNGSTDFNACVNTTSLTANSTDGFMARYSGDSWSSGIRQISGPDPVCSSNATFSISSLPSGVSINWTRSSNLNYVSGQGTANYTVIATSGAKGQGWVQAVITSPCGTATRTKHMWLGTPDSFTTQEVFVPGFRGTDPIELAGGALYEFQIDPGTVLKSK